MAKLRLGAGAKVSILFKYLHPKRLVQEHYPNAPANQRLEEFEVLRVGKKVINKIEREVVMVSHNVFNHNVLYCCVKYAKVTAAWRISHNVFHTTI